MMEIEVAYMSGAGNLFSVIDNSKYNFNTETGAKLARLLCFKNDINPYKTDGLILINVPIEPNTDFSAVFYNPDGSNDAMCGNGGRCAVYFASLLQNIKFGVFNTFSMAGSIYEYDYDSINELISLYFAAPLAYKNNFYVKGNSEVYSGTFVDVGTKHLILAFDKIIHPTDSTFNDFNILPQAREIRYSEEFAPHGVNVNFYQIDNKTVFLRTYERGVEFETGACGTGALSAAIAINGNHLLEFPIKIVPTSGVPLYINKISDNKYSLTGPAEIFDRKAIITDINL